jgi:hypothetical protein
MGDGSGADVASLTPGRPQAVESQSLMKTSLVLAALALRWKARGGRRAEPTDGAQSPHFLGVSETLALGRRLGLRMPERVKVFAIEIEGPFTLGTALGPALEATLPGIVARIAAAVPTLV